MPHGPTSLSRTVPLFIGLLLLLVIGVASTIEYVQLRRLLVQMNEQRLESATVLVSQILSEQLASGGEGFGQAADTLVAELLDLGMDQGPEQDALLREQLSDDGSLRSLMVVAADGSCIGIASGGKTAALSNDPCAEWVEPQTDVEGFVVGPLYDVAVEPRYRVSVPKEIGGWRGWVVFESALGSARGGELIASLIAPDADFVLGNADGGLWTDLGSVVPGPPGVVPGAGLLRFESEGDSRVGAVYRIAGTPWVALAHRSLGVVLAPSRTFLGWTAASGVLVLLLSSMLGWWLSRRITRPLIEVTEGAESFADGDYGRRVSVDRNDEVGRLAAAFNVMAEHADDRRQTLEARVRERTESLQTALDRLEETQDQLVRRERLATLGELAGGVGHELRNPLGVMANAVYYLEAINPDARPKVRDYLGILKSQVGVAEKIVSNLLDFGRISAPKRRDVRLERLVSESLERHPVPSPISVHVDIPDSVPPVQVDADQMERVLINLIGNAVQAMEEREGTLSFLGSVEGDGVVLRVSDTGPGIRVEELERIFEPLVTTKAKGIGLGLALSRLLSSANDVDLTAESEVGRGSTFHLLFRPGTSERAG